MAATCALTANPRFRIPLFLVCASLILCGAWYFAAVFNTIQRLDFVEAERDRWQWPENVLASLDAGDGSVVVDLGSGAGYFTLKLARRVGAGGEVIAVDLRRLSLFFLRLRALLQRYHNIQLIHGDPTDPHLPSNHADAVLMSNTYHEFADPDLMLDHTYRALKPGGRVVILDRDLSRDNQGHGLSSEPVADALRRHGFEVLSLDDHFVHRAGDEPWWLLVAKRQ